MSTVAAGAHRAHPGPLLTITLGLKFALQSITIAPGLKFALQSIATIAIIGVLSYSYGCTGRNMITDLVHVVGLTWTVATNPWTWAAVAITVLIVKHVRVMAAAPKGSHRG